MNNSIILDKVLSVIDEIILLDHDVDHNDIVKKIYIETKYNDQDFNKFLAVITVGKLTLGKYIRERRLYFAVCDMMNNPKKALVDIALDYGYSEQSAFTRAVSRTYGKPPAELKKSKEEIPDNREELENCLSDKSRLESVLESIMSDDKTVWQENSYFDAFIEATEKMGFDLSTCCIISELSEKLDIPFAGLLNMCFDMMIDYHSDPNYIPAKTERAIDLGIGDSEELDSICRYYQCEYYELTKEDVTEYRKDHCQ